MRYPYTAAKFYAPEHERYVNNRSKRLKAFEFALILVPVHLLQQAGHLSFALGALRPLFPKPGGHVQVGAGLLVFDHPGDPGLRCVHQFLLSNASR